MVTEHDKIMMSLNKERLYAMVLKLHYKGEKTGAWASNFWSKIGVNDILSFDEHDMYALWSELKESKQKYGELVSTLCENRRKCYDFEERNPGTSIRMEYSKEYPLIKGTGQYATKLGFADLIICFEGLKLGRYDLYSDNKPHVWFFEIKTMKELMSDIGEVLRQLQFYRSAFGKYIGDDDAKCQQIRPKMYEREMSTWLGKNCFVDYFLVVPDKVDDNVKEMFTNEGFRIIELCDYP